MFEKGTYYRFGQKVFYLSILRSGVVFVVGIIAVVFISGLVGFVTPIGTDILLGGAIIFLLYAIGALLLARYNYACHEFMLDEYAIHIRTGIINRSEMSIPYRQIQDVNVEDSYAQRMFGVASLSLLTAGHEDPKYSRMGEAGVPEEESSALFPLIDRKYAEELQKVLMRSSNVQEIVGVAQVATVAPTPPSSV